MKWLLAEPAEGVRLYASDKGILLEREDSQRPFSEFISILKPITRLGRLIPTLIPQLLELEFCDISDSSILIYYDTFVELEANGIDAFEDIVHWSPLAIEICSTGTIGTEYFKYIVRYYLGRNQASIRRLGCFVEHSRKIYRLDKATYRLLEHIDNFNSLPDNQKLNASNTLISFSEIKGLAEGLGADIDRYIHDQNVIIMPKIGLDLIAENDGRISFVPKLDEIPEGTLSKAFLRSEDIEDVYSLDTQTGGRIRVILSEDQKEVLRRMRKVRKLAGADKAKVLSNPYEVFDGVANAVEIDLSQYGPRVKGIGDFPFISQPFIQYGSTGIFDDVVPGAPQKAKINVGVRCQYVDGTTEDVCFENRNKLLNFNTIVKAAWEQGKQSVDLNGKTILINKEFVTGIQELVNKVTKPKTEQSKNAGSYLLIYTNEDELEYLENERLSQIDKKAIYIPKSLKDNVELKKHQLEGIRWLQINYLLENRRGCLLADDMGLGKTLQVLCFIAWLIERGELSESSQDYESAPWKPALIIAPVMLLENETWINDMKSFFSNEGDIFRPWLTLHGSELKKYRKLGFSGRETQLETSVLDLERLRQNRIVLTNYETIVNYQYSFAKMKSDWTVIVTDEAQEYKTPNTKISHALKSLSPRFRIASTGTPVETRLTDVWNIFDYLQPGDLLRSAAEFAKVYEKPIMESPDSRAHVLGKLKERLLFGRSDSYLLRREKADALDGLPEKNEIVIKCYLSPEQRNMHLDFIRQVQQTQDVHPFSIIHSLMKLYQHPALLPRYDGIVDQKEAFDRCPKLKEVVKALEEIRSRREKALIFTRSLDMQQLLAHIISNYFDIQVDIVNGITKRTGGTRSGNNTRKEIVSRFCNSTGFNVIILSPDVAGIGLTLVEANNVIHYGRWWNPAKELQATDRVYRIGQEKAVNVYYPIAVDPQNEFKTFDERLHDLIQKRRDLAFDFLTPLPSEEELGNDLLKDILSDTNTGEAQSTYLTPDDINKLPWDRFESLIALLEKKQGRDTILTPRSGDYGIDVISIRKKSIKLIQCKHTIWGASLNVDVIAETVNAFDNYRGRILSKLSAQYVLTPILVTNGKCTRDALTQAKISGVTVIQSSDFMSLFEKSKCSYAELEQIENTRVGSIGEVKAKLDNLYSNSM